MENKKYILTNETIKVEDGSVLYRIRAVKDFGDVHKGDYGGWIKSESNLSQKDDCWVYNEARVSGNSRVYGYARVFSDVEVYGRADICGDAEIESFEDYAVYKNNWSTGRYFTWTRSNNKWAVGCFYGSGEELIKRAYEMSEISGKCYEIIVKAQEAISNIKNNY